MSNELEKFQEHNSVSTDSNPVCKIYLKAYCPECMTAADSIHGEIGLSVGELGKGWRCVVSSCFAR